MCRSGTLVGDWERHGCKAGGGGLQMQLIDPGRASYTCRFMLFGYCGLIPENPAFGAVNGGLSLLRNIS